MNHDNYHDNRDNYHDNYDELWHDNHHDRDNCQMILTAPIPQAALSRSARVCVPGSVGQ